MAVTLTNQRVGRAAGLFVAFQTARDTAPTNYTVEGRVWQEEASLPVMAERPDDAWMTVDTVGMKDADDYNVAEKVEGRAVVKATRDACRWILTNNFGAWVGFGSNLTYRTQVGDSDQWLSIAYRESMTSPAALKVIEYRDAWFHRVRIHARPLPGSADQPAIVVLDGEFAARKIVPANASNTGFPAAPMQPSNMNVMTTRGTTLTFGGVAIRVSELAVVLDQGLYHEWDTMAGLYEVHKRGPLRAWFEARCEVGDETWTMLTNARADTTGTAVCAFAAGGTHGGTAGTLTVTLYGVVPRFSSVEHKGKDNVHFVMRGPATLAGSNSVTVNVS